MNIRLLSLPFFILTTLLMISCSNDENTTPNDSQPPVIASASVTPGEGNDHIKQGSIAKLSIQFTDNQGLSEARLNIHGAHDDHNHKLTNETIALKWDTIISLSGTKHTEHFDLHIPQNSLTGPYHFTIELTDEAGNEADVYVETFTIQEDPNTPTSFNITSPDLSTETAFDVCHEYVIEGDIKDDDGIDDIHITIAATHNHNHKLLHGDAYEDIIRTEGLQHFTFEDYNINIPCSTTEGHYTLFIEVTDMDGNHELTSGEIHIQGEDLDYD